MVTLRELVQFMEQLRLVLYEATHIVTFVRENQIPPCLQIHIDIMQANRNVGYPLNRIQIGVMHTILSTFIEWRNEEKGGEQVMPCNLIFESLQNETTILDTLTVLLYNVLL